MADKPTNDELGLLYTLTHEAWAIAMEFGTVIGAVLIAVKNWVRWQSVFENRYERIKEDVATFLAEIRALREQTERDAEARDRLQRELAEKHAADASRFRHDVRSKMDSMQSDISHMKANVAVLASQVADIQTQNAKVAAKLNLI